MKEDTYIKAIVDALEFDFEAVRFLQRHYPKGCRHGDGTFEPWPRYLSRVQMLLMIEALPIDPLLQ